MTTHTGEVYLTHASPIVLDVFYYHRIEPTLSIAGQSGQWQRGIPDPSGTGSAHLRLSFSSCYIQNRKKKTANVRFLTGLLFNSIEQVGV